MTQSSLTFKIGGASNTSRDDGRVNGPSVGKRTLVEQIAPGPSSGPTASAAPGDVAVPAASSSGGAPLPLPVRTRMERAFGYDFSQVRVHEGPEAEAMGALAFTRGTDVYFRPGLFDPQSERGCELLGHELAHVAQQAQGRVGATRQVRGQGLNDDASLEHEADALSARALRGDRSPGDRATIPGGAALPVAQARTAGVVQRALGMELETTLPIIKEVEYHAALYDNRAYQWKITNDGGKVEFVTRPLRDKAELLLAVRQITQFVEAAKRLLAGASAPVAIAAIVEAAGLLPEGAHGLVGGGDYQPSMLDAKPQVTVGIPMERMAQLLIDARSLELPEYYEQHEPGPPEGERGETSEAQTSSPPPKAGHKLLYDESSPFQFELPSKIDSLAVALQWGATMKRSHPERHDIDGAVGLMALVLKYLNDAQFKPPRAGTPEYPKAYFPVMARTHFTAMYESIGDAAELFTPEAILACWGQGVETAKRTHIFALGYRDESKTGTKNEHGVNRGPTIWEWLVSIAGEAKAKAAINRKYEAEDAELTGHYANSTDEEFRDGTRGAKHKDLLSRGAVAFNNVSMGLFGMDRREDTPLAVVEFRQFPTEEALQPAYWEKLAGRLFDFYAKARTGDKDPSAAYTQLLWTKDILASLRHSIVRQTNALRDTQDDAFNDKALALRGELLPILARLAPTDHDGITAFVVELNARLKILRAEHEQLPRTSAPSITVMGTRAAMKRGLKPNPKRSEVVAFLRDYFARALAALYIEVPKDEATLFNEEVARASSNMIARLDYLVDYSDWEEFYEDRGKQIADLQDRGAHYKKTGALDDLSIDGAADAREARVKESGAVHAKAMESSGGGLADYIRGELEKAKLELAKRDRSPAAVLAARVNRVRAGVEKALDAANSVDKIHGVVDSFVQAYAKLRALFFPLENGPGAQVPRQAVMAHDNPGNCLFNSVSHMLGGDPNPAELRRLTAERVRLNPLDYVDRLVNAGGYDDVMVEMQRAATFLATNNAWDAEAGELAPIALADVLAADGRQLVILNANGSVRFAGPNGGTPVFIYYNGVNHYEPGERQA